MGCGGDGGVVWVRYVQKNEVGVGVWYFNKLFSLDMQCWADGLCNGVLVGDALGVNGNECLARCKADEDCQWFTHDSEGDGACLMLSDCPELDTSCESCKSGHELCDPREEPINAGKALFTQVKFSLDIQSITSFQCKNYPWSFSTGSDNFIAKSKH